MTDTTTKPESGRKFDSDKPEYNLLPANALNAMVQCLTYGARKYAPENWRYVPEANRRYFDAAQRHLWAIARGEEIDPESGMHHVTHAIISLMFLYEHMTGQACPDKNLVVTRYNPISNNK